MQIPDEIRLGAELLGLLATGGTILFKLGRMGEKFEAHSKQLEETKMAINKIEETLQAVAVQKDQIASIREMMTLSTKRTDDTFARIFNTLERQGSLK